MNCCYPTRPQVRCERITVTQTPGSLRLARHSDECEAAEFATLLAALRRHLLPELLLHLPHVEAGALLHRRIISSVEFSVMQYIGTLCTKWNPFDRYG